MLTNSAPSGPIALRSRFGFSYSGIRSFESKDNLKKLRCHDKFMEDA